MGDLIARLDGWCKAVRLNVFEKFNLWGVVTSIFFAFSIASLSYSLTRPFPIPRLMMERRFFSDDGLCDAFFWFVDGAWISVAAFGGLCGEWIAGGVGSGSSVGVAVAESDRAESNAQFDAQSDA